MQKLLQQLGQALQAGQDLVLVTIIASSGSTPRGAGAHMLVSAQGRIGGTIGGGAVEHQCELEAIEVLKRRSSKTGLFRLHPNQVQDLGMICGGEVDVYFQYLAATDAAVPSLCAQAEVLYTSGEDAWLICDITEEGSGALSLYGRVHGLLGAAVPRAVLQALGSRPAQTEAEGRTYYSERLTQSGRVYIFGGGHVSQALVPTLAAVGFRCVVLENRPEFCDIQLFPGAERTELIDLTQIAEQVSITADDYVCVMTRGHKDDLAVQAQVLRTPAHYIGVIGSARKTAGVFAKLKEQGFTDADLARITTPIGLPILAETPAEIAVSITAQLIEVRARHVLAE